MKYILVYEVYIYMKYILYILYMKNVYMNVYSFCVSLECKQILYTQVVLQKGWDLELDGMFENFSLILLSLILVAMALLTSVGKNQE